MIRELEQQYEPTSCTGYARFEPHFTLTMAFSEKDHGFRPQDGGVTSAMMQQALSQIPPTSKTNTTSSAHHSLPRALQAEFGVKGLVHTTGPIEDSLNEEAEVDFHGFSTDPDKSSERSYQPDSVGLFTKSKYGGSFTSSEDPRSPKSTSDFSGDLSFYGDKSKSRGVKEKTTALHDAASVATVPTREEAFQTLEKGTHLATQKDIVDKLYNTKPGSNTVKDATMEKTAMKEKEKEKHKEKDKEKEKEKERKGLQRGAGVRRKKRARASGGGAKAVRVPADKEFAPGLSGPITTLLRDGGRKLNPLQMQKLVDATTALQQMQVHILEPLTLYTAAELYDLMASMTETWKNSGKAAWKKRINKIRENSRGRKPPRNKLDEGEIAEIMQLEKQIKEREEWEKFEKQKMLKERERNSSEASKRKKREDQTGKKKRKKLSSNGVSKSPKSEGGRSQF